MYRSEQHAGKRQFQWPSEAEQVSIRTQKKPTPGGKGKNYKLTLGK